MNRTNAVALFVVVLGASCIPTSARKNAKIEPGFDFEATAGYDYISTGEDRQGRATSSDQFVRAELAVQGASELDSGGAIAVQVKIPLLYVFATLDAFYQLPSQGDFYAGVGIEASLNPGVYAVLTKYLSDDFYFSFTPRVLALGVNPQIAAGINNEVVDFSLYAGYMRAFGKGIDFESIFSDDPDDGDFRKHFFLAGAAARF